MVFGLIGSGRVIQTTARKVAMLTIKSSQTGKLVYTPCCLKSLFHLAEYFLFRLFTIEKKSAIANNLKPINVCIDENTMFIQIFTNVFPIILRFTMTVSQCLQTNEAE